MPINLHTICQCYERYMTPDEARKFLEKERIGYRACSNLEEFAISQVGEKLYKLLIEGYTKKQWNCDPVELNPDIIKRLPVRYSLSNVYFEDVHQGIPVNGYDTMIKKMLQNPLIELRTSTDFFEMRDKIHSSQKVIYTGPIDKFFDYKLGTLGWRSVDFKFETLEKDDFQGNSVINYTDADTPFTRIHEFKHYTPERSFKSNKTVICREYPGTRNIEEPFYPMNRKSDEKLYQEYNKLARSTGNVFMGGRLGLYKYLDMDDAIEQALLFFNDNFKEF